MRFILIQTFAPKDRTTAGFTIRSVATRRKFLHTMLMFGWIAFWLNTALFPCCDALAEALDGHVHGSTGLNDTPHSVGADHSHQEPASDCGSALDLGAPSSGEYFAFTSDQLRAGCVLSNVQLTVAPLDVTRSVNLPSRDYHPPPPLWRIYLRTQRLLI